MRKLYKNGTNKKIFGEGISRNKNNLYKLNKK